MHPALKGGIIPKNLVGAVVGVLVLGFIFGPTVRAWQGENNG